MPGSLHCAVCVSTVKRTGLTLGAMTGDGQIVLIADLISLAL